MTERPDLLETLGSEEAVRRAHRIAALNDSLRRSIPRHDPKKSTVLFMGDLAAELCNADMVRRLTIQSNIFAAIRGQNDFSEANDPYGEHDYGSFSYNGETLMWKISYYDLNQEYHSPDETDPAVTHRVLTIYYVHDH